MTDTKELRKHMIDNNLTQSDLAEKLGCSKSTLSLKMSGKADFNQEEMTKIVQLFKLDAKESFKIFFAN